MKGRQKILLGLALAVMTALLFLIVYGGNGFMDLARLRQERDLLLAQKAELEEENERLSRMIRRLREDPEYIENMARHKLKMIGKDEKVYKFTGRAKEGN